MFVETAAPRPLNGQGGVVGSHYRVRNRRQQLQHEAGLRYYARKRAAYVEDIDRDVVYVMHGGRCGICSEFIAGAFHADHVKPLSEGGKDSYANMQPAHVTCNLRKGNRV